MRDLRLVNEQPTPRAAPGSAARRAKAPGADTLRALREIGIYTLPAKPKRKRARKKPARR
jgi:hypothetical protein